MLQPTRTKFRKAHKGRVHGDAVRASSLNYGQYGLKALQPDRIIGKQIEAARYRRVDKLSVTVASRYFFFLNIRSIRCVTIKPPKIFTEANITAKKPRTREKENTLSSVPSIIVTPLCEPTAITAPTTIIPEMALVTDIRGVCNAGVTFQTT